MAFLRRIIIALLTATLVATGAARAASSTNFSDQWWIEAESGWGASVLQQADTLFIDLFVYGDDTKPTWFTVAAFYQVNGPAGHVLFAGDLYQTNGPYFGGSFSSAVTYAWVGTLTFDADTVNTARLTYTVNGTQVVKDVSRQFWRYDNLAGTYYGGFVWDQACGVGGTSRDHQEFFGSLRFTHSAANAIRIDVQPAAMYENGVSQTIPSNTTVTITGPYTQSGHMGQVLGTVTYVMGPDAGTMSWNLFEIEQTINGITGRFVGTATSPEPCTYNGRFGGVLR